MWKFHKNKPEHNHNMKEFNKLERSHSLWKQAEKEIVHIQLAHSKHLKNPQNFLQQKHMTLYCKMK